MALDKAIKDQLTQYLAMLESEVVFAATLGEDDSSTKVREFLEEIAEMSPKITIQAVASERTPSFRSIVPVKKAASLLLVYR